MTALDPAFAPDATVVVRDLSVWFGPKVALSELSCSFGPGVTGLLGPNGAGKTTLMRAMTGLLAPNTGELSVLGANPRDDREVQRSLALVPEDEAVPPVLTARQLVRYVADLHGITGSERVDHALDTVDLLDVADRRVGGFSKGMRQRTKIAAALVTDPQVLVLDEPLNGADPVQRAHLITLFRSLGEQGRTVIVELPRVARGRTAGGTPDRAGARPPRCRRRAPRDTRRDGGSSPPRARPHAGSTPFGGRPSRARRRQQHHRRRVQPDRLVQPGEGRRDRVAHSSPDRSTRDSKRCDLSTTRWRACSGSSSRERQHRGAPVHVASLDPREAVVDARVALCGCDPARPPLADERRRTRSSVRARRRRRPVLALDPDRLPGHR